MTATQVCEIKLDRIVLLVRPETRSASPISLPGFSVEGDVVPEKGAYGRVRVLRNSTSETFVSWSYRPKKFYLTPWKLSICPSDEMGCDLPELVVIAQALPNHRLLLAEISLDFPLHERINRTFVLKHGLFGKSRRNKVLEIEPELRFGSRKGGKFVRVYWKKEIERFRIELQIQSPLLRKCSINTLTELGQLPGLIAAKHIRFGRLDYERLGRYVQTDPDGRRILKKVRTLSLLAALHFLRRIAGVPNPHRFVMSVFPTRGTRMALYAKGKEWRQQLLTKEGAQ